MIKTLVPIAALLVTVALFFVYIKPTFDAIRLVEDETHEYREAIDNAENLQIRLDELIQEQNTLSIFDLERLEVMVPETINEVLVLIDLAGLAEKHSLFMNEITVDTEGELSTLAANDTIPTPPSGGEELPEELQEVNIGFSVIGSYEQFKAFVRDIEQSLVFMEIFEISFVETEGELFTFDMIIRTYALNNEENI